LECFTKLDVLLFASYADAFGAPHVAVTLGDGATVEDLLAHVRELAAGRALPPSPLVAVNQCYARPDERIRAGDEVALIPPVAGG
jgi:molybdopterin converting factor subunit 1